MKNLIITWLIMSVILLTWCEINHNFMDVDNTNAREDLQNFIWSWNIPKINTKDIIPDNLSWTLDNAKWYANKYYEENLQEYVNVAKEWLSWTTQKLKWYYNEWVDQLNWVISEKVNQAISWELNKLKLK